MYCVNVEKKKLKRDSEGKGEGGWMKEWGGTRNGGKEGGREGGREGRRETVRQIDMHRGRMIRRDIDLQNIAIAIIYNLPINYKLILLWK